MGRSHDRNFYQCENCLCRKQERLSDTSMHAARVKKTQHVRKKISLAQGDLAHVDSERQRQRDLEKKPNPGGSQTIEKVTRKIFVPGWDLCTSGGGGARGPEPSYFSPRVKTEVCEAQVHAVRDSKEPFSLSSNEGWSMKGTCREKWPRVLV